MQDFVKEALTNENSEFHKTFLEDSKALVELSRRKMSSYYDQWDRSDEVYRGIQLPDKDDTKAAERKEPVKFIVPISYSQIQTFIAFCYTLYTQRERFFELTGMSEEDHRPAKIGEAFLARDLSYNVFERIMYQFLLDISRFGIGIIKSSWVHEKQMINQVRPNPLASIPFLGKLLAGAPTVERVEATKFLGNKLLNVSPYRFFPDVRLPISRFQEGEFVASEDEYSYTTLKDMEKRGELVNISKLKPMSKEAVAERRTRLSTSVDQNPSMSNAQSKGVYILTEMQRSIIPNEYDLGGGQKLGPEDHPVKYLISYVNDQRLVRLEPLTYIHNQFTYDLAEFSPDQHNLLNQGLSDIIEMLQSTLSWFINSRITSVRKVIQNQLVVDPEGIKMEDVEQRRPVIRLKPSAGRMGVDRFIKQLDLSDVTTNHLKDAEYLQKLVEITTGINENLLGQFHSGRRSATEGRNVFSSSTNRLRMTASVIFRTCFEPLGKKMLSNLQDGLDEETVVRLVGLEPAAQAEFVKVDKSAIIGNYDFEVFDGTLPSEKAQRAAILGETLAGLMKNPEAAIAMRIDPMAIWLEILELQGIRNPERFTLKAPPAAPENVVSMDPSNGAQPLTPSSDAQLSGIIQS